MFREVYNRCKTYLNSYVTIGTIILLLLFLLLPTFTYKESYSFFSILRTAYQYSLVNVLTLMLYIYNIWNYLHKNISITYQAHRYGSAEKIIKNNIYDIIFIGIILELVFMILNVSIAILYNDGYYMSIYKYYDITNIAYLIYVFITRVLFVSIISVLVYFIYYIDNKKIKICLAIIISFNLLNFNSMLPLSMNTILVGYKFNSFFSEILTTSIMICFYFIAILLIKIKFINKKRDIG